MTPCGVAEVSWNVMAHAQKPDLVFRRNGRVHLNRRGRQFSLLLAAEVCASAVVMLDTTCSEVVWRVLATHSIRQFPLHFPSLRHRVPSYFNWSLHRYQGFGRICCLHVRRTKTKQHGANGNWEMWLWFDPMEIASFAGTPPTHIRVHRPFSFFKLRFLISYTSFTLEFQLSQNFILSRSLTSVVGIYTRPQVRRPGVRIQVWARGSSLPQHLHASSYSMTTWVKLAGA